MKIIKLKSQHSNNILIVGGVHGDEYTPLIVLEKFRTLNNHADHNVKIIPFVNLEALKARMHDDFSLKLDLNRAFANKDTIKNLYPELAEALEWADIVIDLHTHRHTQTLPYAVIFQNSKPILKLAKDLGIKYYETPTKQETERVRGTMVFNALKDDKIGLIIEMSNLSESSKPEIELFQNIKKFLLGKNIVNGTESKEIIKVSCDKDCIVVKNSVKLGMTVQKGDKLSEILDINTRELTSTKSAMTGQIITLPLKTFIKKDQAMYRIAS